MQFSRLGEKVVTSILVVCCVNVTLLSIRQQFFRSPPPPPGRPSQPASGRPLPPGLSLRAGGLRLGRVDAPLQVVEFADFECPFCAVAAGELEEVWRKYPSRISVVFRHMPIEAHPHARDAALAAECAGDQGAFEKYYFALFANYAKLNRRSWRDYAKQSSVPDLNRFDRCLRAGQFRERIDADVELARKVGVVGTPTWIVGDSVYGGVPSVEQIEGWLFSVGRASERPRTAAGAAASR